MKDDTKKILLYLVLIIVLSFLFGFILGKHFTKTESKTEISYVPQPPMRDTLYLPTPVEEITPPAPEIKWLVKHDTITVDNTIYVTEVVDTTAILNDWVQLRKYEERLFSNDTIGCFDITANVQYNRLQHIGYNFIPVRKETTITKTQSPIIRPFVMGGVNSQWRPALEVGTFVRSGWGASYEIQMLDDKKYLHSLKIGYQF